MNSFIEGFAPFFAANPDVEGVLWEQYTPYFNDGDTCEFGVREPIVILNEATARSIRPDGEWDEDNEYFAMEHPRCFEEYDLCETPYDFKNTGFHDLWQKIPEEIFKSVFGDHVQVRIMRDGTVEVEEYEHD